ncbi:MAG: hypothetical protein ACM3WV_04005 [Bacillota bacterium]
MCKQKTRLNFFIPIILITIFGAMLLNDIKTGTFSSLSIVGFIWGILELAFYLIIVRTEGKHYYMDERVKYSFTFGESWGFMAFVLALLILTFYNSVMADRVALEKPADFIYILVMGFLVKTVVTLIYRYQNVSVNKDKEK